MPVRVIGMIGVAPPSGKATVHVIKGGISTAYLRAFAQAHETAGFDLALVGYTASSAEGFLVAQHACVYRIPKPGRSDDEVLRARAVSGWLRRTGLGESPAHPSAMTGEF